MSTRKTGIMDGHYKEMRGDDPLPVDNSGCFCLNSSAAAESDSHPGKMFILDARSCNAGDEEIPLARFAGIGGFSGTFLSLFLVLDDEDIDDVEVLEFVCRNVDGYDVELVRALVQTFKGIYKAIDS